jgi:hypothetical protein
VSCFEPLHGERFHPRPLKEQIINQSLTIQAQRCVSSIVASRHVAMNMSLAAAALAADVNRTTLLIIRAIKGGKVGRGDTHGRWRIAPAEIHRVYPSAPQWSTPDAPQRDTMATLEAQIAGLREVADLLRAQLDETRRDRDKWADATTAALRALPPPAESLQTRVSSRSIRATPRGATSVPSVR